MSTQLIITIKNKQQLEYLEQNAKLLKCEFSIQTTAKKPTPSMLRALADVKSGKVTILKDPANASAEILGE